MVEPFAETTFIYNAPNDTSANVAAKLEPVLIAKFTGPSACYYLKLSTKGCDFSAGDVWSSVKPLIEQNEAKFGRPVVKYQSLKELIIRFGECRPHIDLQSVISMGLQECIRALGDMAFLVSTEVPTNIENNEQQQIADSSVYGSRSGSRRIVGEVMLSEDVAHAMARMMSQRFINRDIKLFFLVFVMKRKEAGRVVSFKLVLQFYKPILTEEEAAGRFTTQNMGADLIDEAFYPNGRELSVKFPGMNRGLEAGWDLCLVNQFVGDYDLERGIPVQMQVIGPMTNAALENHLDLSEGSEDSQRLFNVNIAPYLGEEWQNSACNWDLRGIFAFANAHKFRWFARVPLQESTEIFDARDIEQVDLVPDAYEEIVKKDGGHE